MPGADERRGRTGWLARDLAWSRQQLRRTPDNLVSGHALDAAEILKDQVQVAAKRAGVLHSVMSDFIDDRIVHRPTSSNSSGEQISGHR
jgi:hypothetical protein